MTLPRNLSFRRIGAWVLFIFVILAIWMATISPLLSAWVRKQDQLDRTSEIIAHLRQAADEAPALQQEVTKLAQGQQGVGAVLITAAPNMAVASLQAEVKRIAERSGAMLRSVQELPSAQEDALVKVGVRADLQSDTPQLERILYDLQTHNPVFLVRNISVRGQEQQANSPPQQARTLNIQFDVVAFSGGAQ